MLLFCMYTILQFLYEFGLIAKPSSKDVWSEWGPRILCLADQEKKVMEQLQECEDKGIAT